jgi:RNA polymerase sigma-70 factor, ECF subfamily
MRDAPQTRQSLLARLADAEDHAAWSEFIKLYEPAIYRFVRRRGLQDADAREVVQEVLLNVKRMASDPPVQPMRSFRAWLSQVTKHRLIDLVRARVRRDNALSAISNQLPVHDQEQEFDGEVRHQMFLVAARRVQQLVTEPQWQSFWQTTVELQSPNEVAERLGISIGNLYVSKCRVMERIRQQIEIMQYDETGIPTADGGR